MSSTFRSLAVFARRTLSIPTTEAVIALLVRGGWRFFIRHDDGIDRARSVAATRWYKDTDDDVLVMLDDDIVFTPEDIERVASQCRPGYEIVCGDYIVHNGERRASSLLDTELPDQGLFELRYGAGGCMAIHRSVIETLIPTLPLCHKRLPIHFWPFFMPMVEELPDEGAIYLTEDYAFTARARAVGMHAWLDPQVKLGHLTVVPITPTNMTSMQAMIGEKWVIEV